jgi:hypothetical protein
VSRPFPVFHEGNRILVDDIVILGRDDERHPIQRFLAHYDVPAYVRRARQVEEAFERLLSQCRQRREELLGMVRMQIGQLFALAGDWDALRPWLKDDDQISILQDLHTALQPRASFLPAHSSSARALPRALRELCSSMEQFNRRWQAFLQAVNRSEVNALREAYNRYYLLEKECALRSARLARQGFHRLEPLTVDDLARLLPLLSVPQRT